MKYYLEKILIPYLNFIKKDLNQEDKEKFSPLIICDNLKAHLTDNIKHLLVQNGIRIITIPPHSSHLLQPLDLSFHGVMKKEYDLHQPIIFTNVDKFSRKIECILKAYHSASFPSTIIAGWEKSGIIIKFKSGIPSGFYLDKDSILSKVSKE